MRHFLLLAVPVGGLASGMFDGARAGFLVAATGDPQRLPTGALGATLEAIDLAPITPRANPDLAVTALAVVEAIPGLEHFPPPPEGTGQHGDVGSMLRCQSFEATRRHPKARRGLVSGPLPFLEARHFYHTFGAASPASIGAIREAARVTPTS
jgi:hypothetical protein